MAVQPIPRLINILRSTLVLLGDYAENRQVETLFLDLKYSLFKAIAELERLPAIPISAQRPIEISTSLTIPRESRK